MLWLLLIGGLVVVLALAAIAAACALVMKDHPNRSGWVMGPGSLGYERRIAEPQSMHDWLAPERSWKDIAVGEADAAEAMRDRVIDLWNEQGGWIPGTAYEALADALGVEVDRLTHYDKAIRQRVQGWRDQPRGW